MSRISYVFIVLIMIFMVVLLGYEYRDIVTGKAVKSECSDSDNGKDFYLKGIATKGSDSSEDFCAARLNAVPGRTNKVGDLIEFYCKEDGTYDSVAYTCPNNCLNGACILLIDETLLLEPVIATDAVLRPCTDSDGGKAYESKGKIEGSAINKNTAEDECMLMGGKPILAERYCYSAERGAVEYYDCSKKGKGCEDGACAALEPVKESKDLSWMYSVLSDKVITKEPGCSYGGQGNYGPLAAGYVNIPAGLTPTEEGYKLFIGNLMKEYCDAKDPKIKWEFYCDSHGYAHIAKVKCYDMCSNGACERD